MIPLIDIVEGKNLQTFVAVEVIPNYTIRAFIWNSIDSMIPQSNKIEQHLIQK